jgi:hypothetical protein
MQVGKAIPDQNKNKIKYEKIRTNNDISNMSAKIISNNNGKQGTGNLVVV